jgi:RimJ/RimL family protein N-acetyltransferase
LRPPSEADAEQIFARYAQDAEVCRYMSWTPHGSIDDTLEYLRRIITSNDDGSSAGYLIFSRETGQLLGSVGGALVATQEMRVQFGYCLARDAWGRGLATEAARAFVIAVMGEPTVWRIQAFCDVENLASARVLEKAGLTFEGTLRRYMVLPNLGDAPRDMLCYAKVRE